jgi:hypothetical protein
MLSDWRFEWQQYQLRQSSDLQCGAAVRVSVSDLPRTGVHGDVSVGSFLHRHGGQLSRLGLLRGVAMSPEHKNETGRTVVQPILL